MRITTVTVPVVATSISTLIDETPRHTKAVGLQAPESNLDIVYFGDAKSQPFELRPKANAFLPIASFREVHIRTSGPGNKLSIALFDGA